MLRGLFSCAMLVSCTCWLNAAEIESEVSTRETYVGLPITLRINVNNAIEHETPIMPEVDGLKIEQAGPPARSSRTMWINNRKTQRTTVSYAFNVTPIREGVFTIPPVKVIADGLTSITKVVRVVATKSETDDLLLVEIEGDESEIYVGQSLGLTLRIWVRPFRSTEHRVDLDEGEMWKTISRQTSWGVFGERVEELAGNRRRPGGRRVLREDSEGQQRQYFLYELDMTLYPDRPTTIDGQDVRIIVNYPVKLGRSQSPFSRLEESFFDGSPFEDSMFGSFGTQLRVTKHRPIVAESSLEPIVVKPVPSQGRPSDYVGAVGQYSIITEAVPKRVQVGEPITLHIGIDGTGSMDVVRAPPLEIQQDLARDFRVPDDALAGFVDDTRKVFTTTIRPLREDVSEIPPIEYSYFDPKAEQFVRIQSKAIPIDVVPADVLALDAIVGGQSGRDTRPTDQFVADRRQPQTPPLFAGPSVVVTVARHSLSTPIVLGSLLVPPAMWLLAALFVHRAVLGTWVPARRRFHRTLERTESPSGVALALERFLADRFQLAQSRLTRDQTIGSLRAIGRHDLAIRADRLYQSGVGSDTESINRVKQEAAAIVDDVANLRRGDNGRANMIRLGSGTTGVIMLVLASLGVSTGSLQAASLDLSDQQRQQLLAEGNSLYALATGNPDRIEAVQQYAQAADRFRLLVDAGVINDRLYFNLAEARLHSNQLGLSIANYRRALRLAPDNRLYHQRLMATATVGDVNATDNNHSLSKIRSANDFFLRWISPTAVLASCAVAWFAFWLVLALPLLRTVDQWKLPAALTLTLALLLGGSYWLRVSEFTRDDTAVLVAPTILLREGDGEEFAEVTRLDDHVGELVDVLGRRGEWLNIALPRGQRGWITTEQASLI